MSADHMRGVNMANLAAMEQTRMLANTLAQNDDPKFQVYTNSPCVCMHLLSFQINFELF